jgi:flagellar biogenesis protein FliO
LCDLSLFDRCQINELEENFKIANIGTPALRSGNAIYLNPPVDSTAPILYYCDQVSNYDTMKNELKIWLILLLIVLVSCAVPLYAQDSSVDKSDKTGDDTSVVPSDIQTYDEFLADDSSNTPNRVFSATSLLNLFFAIAIVICAIWALGYILRSVFARLPGYAGKDNFKVLNTLKLSTQSSLYVVRFMDEIFLIGGTGQKVTLIERITEPEKVQEIIDSMGIQPVGVNPHAFGTILARRMKDVTEGEGIKLKRQTLEKEQRDLGDTMNRLKNIEDEPESRSGK